MHIARQTPEELVVVASSRWMSALFGAAALFLLWFAATRQEHATGRLVGAALFLSFALMMDLRKTFTVDGVQRIVRWKGHRVLRTESGEIPFDEIADIGTQSTMAAKGNARVCRLTIITPRGVTPMAHTYNGQPDGYSALRSQILEFVRRGSTAASS